MSHLWRGAAAGAAGTTALQATTYLDMLLRARGPSSTPEETVRRAEQAAGTSLSSDDEAEGNRRSAAGALLGIVTGVASGVGYAVARGRWPRLPTPVLAVGVGLLAAAGSNAPMTALGVTDPRTWDADSWVSDLVPHLCYGIATAGAFEAMNRRLVEPR
ncbi:hypothetical protein [Saccharopolyspora cebuensis]|uniref:DUF1440 domain-containing protein n=1 Tax=Saccharopolyspora cebuensis TaxID=418759 RepID=A0ABV4CLB4_9PSEU